jgi:hypothetical protein
MKTKRILLTGLVIASLLALTSVALAQQTQGPSGSGALAAVVRAATARFRNVTEAEAAGYGLFHGCVSGPQSGAMGIHYVNGDLVGDGELNATQPEALMYEMRNGQLRLVGVEYVVIAEAWDAAHETPPTLNGQVFHYVGAPNRYRIPAFYELHVWAWKHNPNGAFADWNSWVTCDEFTAEAMTDLSAAAHGSH